MIIELGHFALVLALLVAALQTVVPLVGASRGDARLMAFARPRRAGPARLRRHRVRRAAACLHHLGLHVAAVATIPIRRKPLLYKITGLWGNHEGSLVLWVSILALFGACGRPLRPQPAAASARPGPGGAGADRRRLPRLHAVHLQPVPAARPGAARRRRAQPDPAGSRPRLPPAHALSRLCRALDRPSRSRSPR